MIKCENGTVAMTQLEHPNPNATQLDLAVMKMDETSTITSDLCMILAAVVNRYGEEDGFKLINVAIENIPTAMELIKGVKKDHE